MVGGGGGGGGELVLSSHVACMCHTQSVFGTTS